jgi:hypothetical protein
MDNFFTSRGKKNGQEPEGWWQLSTNKEELAERNPALPFLFSEVDTDLSGWELALLEGFQLRDLQGGLNTTQKNQLRAFVHCFGDSQIENGDDDHDFLTNFSSGVTLEVGESHTVKEMLMLPQLVRSIVAPHAQLDPRIRSLPSGGMLGGMLRSRGVALRDCRTVYVVVFGGISFLELREIRQVCAKGNQQIAVRVISDTICSAVKLL